MSEPKSIEGLLAEARPGFSLPAGFYTDPAVFEAEVEAFLGRHWILAGHESEIAAGGQYLRFEVAGASLILVRGQDGVLRAFHNVCRHRGAQLCEAPQGKLQRLTCRYHAWSFALDGSLAAWRHMPPGLDKADYGLRPCAVAILDGLIFVSLSPDTAPDFEAMRSHVAGHLARYELADCKVAATATYEMAANWKLGIENNLECYHCLPSHPEYRALHGFVRADEQVSPASIAARAAHDETVARRLAAAGMPTGLTEILNVDGQRVRAGVLPLSEGVSTQAADGLPVAPLLGRLTEHDETSVTGAFGFNSFVSAVSDYALLITYVPRAVDRTDVILKWLVHREAREGEDYDPAKLRWLWDETTKQDKDLIELNARGVGSRGYRPGPYSELESGTARFVADYLDLMRAERG